MWFTEENMPDCIQLRTVTYVSDLSFSNYEVSREKEIEWPKYIITFTIKI